jgi:cell division septation protein DedD
MQVRVKDVGFGYSPYPHELSRDASISLQAKGLYAVYGSFVSINDPTAWPSSQYICKLCGVNEKTFWKYKRELLKSGWIGEVQQHKENGQYASMLITRYYHPSMNPDFVVKSTALQKTEHRKTEHHKTEVKQEPKTPTKKHTQTKAVCVSPAAQGKPEKDWQGLSQEQRDCIEWTVQEFARTGHLKNEIGMRCHLVKAAKTGELSMDAYQKHLKAKKQANNAVSDLSSKIDDWKREAEESPITPAFMAEMKKKYARLFV